MAKARKDLQIKLEQLLESRNVYFQPPENLKIKYPCIIYQLSNIPITYADNTNYMDHNRYQLTVIDQNPDSIIPRKILSTFPLCSHSSRFISDNLNHDVFTLFF